MVIYDGCADLMEYRYVKEKAKAQHSTFIVEESQVWLAERDGRWRWGRRWGSWKIDLNPR
jgi:hypothetical protein